MLAACAAAAFAWAEVPLRNGRVKPHATPEAAAAALASGGSVLLLPGAASADECDALVQACSVTLDAGQRLTRLPSSAAAARAAETDDAFNGDPHADAPLSQLPADADVICDAILKRVLSLIDEQLSPVAVAQFGTARLSDLYAAGELEYAEREPAVNVYGPGGEFPPHEDHQALTVIVPLSGHGGGGTGFWLREEEGGYAAEADEEAAVVAWEAEDQDEWEEVAAAAWETEDQDEWEDEWEDEEWRGMERPATPPSMVLRPKRGTAMLFSGEVLHAGMPVEHASRVVLVASFSGVQFWPDA